MDRYKQRVREAFDSVALAYDRRFDSSELNSFMRSASLQLIDSLFQPGGRVLDVGCGTGREAIHLANRGVRVVATDISPRMTQLATAKAKEAGVAKMVDVRTMPANDLYRLKDEGMVFDGAFSSFGALNCEPNLRAVAAGLASLLTAGSPLIVTMVNRLCLSELVIYSLAGRPSKALRRLATPATISLTNGAGLEIYLHTLHDAVDAFAPHFTLIKSRGLLVFLPPPDLEGYWQGFGALRTPALRMEQSLAGHSPFTALGDHYLLHLRRVG